MGLALSKLYLEVFIATVTSIECLIIAFTVGFELITGYQCKGTLSSKQIFWFNVNDDNLK